MSAILPIFPVVVLTGCHVRMLHACIVCCMCMYVRVVCMLHACFVCTYVRTVYMLCAYMAIAPVICLLQEVEALQDALDQMHHKLESKEAEIKALLRVNSEHLDMIQLVSLLVLVVRQCPRNSYVLRYSILFSS